MHSTMPHPVSLTAARPRRSASLVLLDPGSQKREAAQRPDPVTIARAPKRIVVAFCERLDTMEVSDAAGR